MSEELKKLGEAAQFLSTRGSCRPVFEGFDLANRIRAEFTPEPDGTFTRKYPVGGDGAEHGPADGVYETRVSLESLRDDNFISGGEHDDVLIALQEIKDRTANLEQELATDDEEWEEEQEQFFTDPGFGSFKDLAANNKTN